MSYTLGQIQYIGKTNPKELIRIIDHSDSDIKQLVIAIETLGEKFEDESLALPVFKRYLKHIHLLVRESALVAITSFYEDKVPPNVILDRLKVISSSDPSMDLKDFANDLLKEFSKTIV